MSLLENQSFRKKISFVKSGDDEKCVTFNISVQCNHDIDKSILNEIEDTINDMFLKDYEDADKFQEQKKLQSALEKQEKELQRQQQKKDREYQKEMARQNKENLKYQQQLQKLNNAVHKDGKNEGISIKRGPVAHEVPQQQHTGVRSFLAQKKK
jgi:FKBP-type peptidyl-prolyl cis-trans isomerase